MIQFFQDSQLPQDFERRASMDTNEGYTTKGSASSGVSSDLVTLLKTFLVLKK